MKVHVGTSGYSYAEWKGSFYPEDLSASDMLGYYAERLTAVEINNTFYRLPKASVLASWADQVGLDFRFSIKASRRITHFARLKPEAVEPTRYLLTNLSELGGRLGTVLFQLPPNMKADLERLRAFLDFLPKETPAAFEFRHPSWSSPEVIELLADRGVALVHADTDEGERDAALESTADWGYVRLRRAAYSDADLASWLERIEDTGWRHAFVFFKHEDEAAGPRMAGRFLELAGGGAQSSANDTP